MINYKHCPNGHYYDGRMENCPYCKQFEFEIESVPICSHCGRPIRTKIRKPDFPVGSLDDAYDGKVPWNYHWDGRCEHCGHDFGISIRQILPNIVKENSDKWTSIRPSSRTIRDPMADIVTMLSGVEIETKLNGATEKIFLSTNELKYILDELKASPILAQLDWSQDYT